VAESVPVSTLEVGDLVVVHTNDVVPADGSIVLGSGLLSDTLLSGERLHILSLSLPWTYPQD